MNEEILRVENLKTYFYDENGKTGKKLIRAVDGVGFSLNKGEILGIVGESGSGKSITSLSILGLVSGSPGVISGNVIYSKNGKNINLLNRINECVISEEKKKSLKWMNINNQTMKNIRGKEIAYIFQEYASSLNPLITVYDHIAETLESHNLDKRLVHYWLKQVGLNPEEVLARYPHELAGGMAQRVMIVLALCTKPKILISDEATTNLDAVNEQQIIKLLMRLKRELSLSILFISHNLQLVNEIADSVAVMYAGRIVEYKRKTSGDGWKHPYSLGLMGYMKGMVGDPPDPRDLPEGCKFHPRGKNWEKYCKNCIKGKKLEPPLECVSKSNGHLVRCFKV